MMATPQQIAAAYQDTVGKGLMSEAEFVSRAQSEFQVTPAQLVAAQAILVGADDPVVQNSLRALPQQEVVNYLRASTPAQTQITPTQDPNALGGMATSATGAGGEQFMPIYSQEAEGAPSQVVGYTRYLAEFDPTYEGGQYGSYIGVYDTQGNLTDVKFQKGERNAGALQEFATRYGYLVPLGAAAAGAAGLLPDFTGAGASALDPFGAELAFGNVPGAAGAPISASTGTLTDVVGSDWAAGAATGATGGLLPVTEGGLTAANLGAASGVSGAVNQGLAPGIYESIAGGAGAGAAGAAGAGAGAGAAGAGAGAGAGAAAGGVAGGLGGAAGGVAGGLGGAIGGAAGGAINWGLIASQLANAFGGYQSSQAAKEAAQIQAELGREALGLQREMFERQIGLQEPFRQGGLSAQNRLMDLLGLGYSPEQIAEEYRQRTSAGMSEGDFVNWARSQGISDNRLLQARNMLAGNRGGMGAGMGDFGSAARPFTMESFRADPGYAFRLGEGLKALERSAAARGGLMSGATGKALQRFGQEAASQEYGNAFNRFYTERNALLNPLLALSGRGQTSASESGQAGQQFGQQAANTLTGIGNVMASGQVGQANAINQAIGQGVSMYNQAQNQNLLNQALQYAMRRP